MLNFQKLLVHIIGLVIVLSVKPNTGSLYFFILTFLEENKLKMFRWKFFVNDYIKRLKEN